MLRQIYQSVPMQYSTKMLQTFGFGVVYYNAIPPWTETIAGLSSLFVHNIPSPTSGNTIYLLARLNTNYWPSWNVSFHRFDSTKGTYLERVPLAGTTGTLTLDHVVRARSGRLYWRTIYLSEAYEFSLQSDGSLHFISTLSDDHFGLSGLGFSGDFAIDDVKNLYLNASNNLLTIHNFKTGVKLDQVTFPYGVRQLSLEDASHVYILFDNDLLCLYDYVRKEVMGVTRVPPEAHGSQVFTWDWAYRRLLFVKQTPNNPDGSSTIVVRGYSLVPYPTRLTKPIPLKVPRSGATIPVLVQAVGDLNEGIGGYVVNAVVTGQGINTGLTITDRLGSSLINVTCSQDLPGTNIEVTASVNVIEPPPIPPGGGTAGG